MTDIRDEVAGKAIEELRLYQHPNGDTESQHSLADQVLRDLLIRLGYGDVIDEWDKVPKWYA